MPLTPPPPPIHFSSRPLLVLALAFGVGIWFQHAGAGLPWASISSWVTGAIAVLAIALAYHLASRRKLVSLRILLWTLAALAAFCAAGAIRVTAWNTLSPTAIGRAADIAEDAWRDGEERRVHLSGRVETPPEHTQYGTRFVIQAETMIADTREHRRTTPQEVTGRVQVSLFPARRDRDEEQLRPHPQVQSGDWVLLRGTLRAPPQPRNPGDSDYGAYLHRQGIHATFSVYPDDDVRVLATSTSPIALLVSGARRRVERSLALFVEAPASRAVLAALLVADRSGIDPAIRNAFAETGLMHLLAVSGLHAMLLGWLFYTLLHPLLGRLGFSFRPAGFLRVVLTLALLGFYVLLTGNGTPVVRAFVMTAVLISAHALQRRSDALNALAGAALILLVIRPTALFDVGFQLSFSAVTALITLTPIIEGWLPLWRGRLTGWIQRSVVASTAATLGTAPVLLVHFGKLPLAGIFLNVLAIPLTAVALGAGFATSFFSAVLPWLAESTGALADLAARTLVWVSTSGAQWMDWSVIEVPTSGNATPSTGSLLVVVLGLLALALWKRPRLRIRVLLGMLGVFAIGAWTGTVTDDDSRTLDVLFLDVGHGDAALIQTPDGRSVLVDAGNATPYRDHGASTVLPALRALGIQRLDAIILSHADADHAGGVPAVLQGIEVNRIVSNGQQVPEGPTIEMTRIADSLGITRQVVQAGDTLQIDPGVRFRVLAPVRRPSPYDDPNEASVILRLEHGDQHFLFLGDAERLTEADLVEGWRPALESDVVKVGHHGSRTSSSPALVEAAGNPSFAVVSVNARSHYNLPNDEPLQRWQNAGADVLATAEHGAVWLRSDGAETWRVAAVGWGGNVAGGVEGVGTRHKARGTRHKAQGTGTRH